MSLTAGIENQKPHKVSAVGSQKESRMFSDISLVRETMLGNLRKALWVGRS